MDGFQVYSTWEPKVDWHATQCHNDAAQVKVQARREIFLIDFSQHLPTFGAFFGGDGQFVGRSMRNPGIGRPSMLPLRFLLERRWG